MFSCTEICRTLQDNDDFRQFTFTMKQRMLFGLLTDMVVVNFSAIVHFPIMLSIHTDTNTEAAPAGETYACSILSKVGKFHFIFII